MMKFFVSKFYLRYVVLLLVLTFTSVKFCTGQTAQQRNVRELSGAGSTLLYSLIDKWSKTYYARTKVRVTYLYAGSAYGLKALQKGEADFAAIDLPISQWPNRIDKEKILQIPCAAHPVAVAYNLPEVSSKTPIRLSGEVLAAIYLGRITLWDDRRIVALNSGITLPKRKITILLPSGQGPMTNLASNYLGSVSPEWRKLQGTSTEVEWPVGLIDKGSTITPIDQEPGSLCFMTWGFALQRGHTVALLGNAAKKFVAPNMASTKAALTGAAPLLLKNVESPVINMAGKDSYPIVILSYLVVSKKTSTPQKRAMLKQFLKWTYTTGQATIEATNAYYAPMPPTIVTRYRNVINGL